MTEPQYATIRVRKEIRDDARVVKAKRGLDWNEFMEYATEDLDPD